MHDQALDAFIPLYLYTPNAIPRTADITAANLSHPKVLSPFISEVFLQKVHKYGKISDWLTLLYYASF